MPATNALTIGQLGRVTATKIETIGYYERIGLLPVPARTAGNYRSYASDHARRLAFIRRARELGFSIEDVRELLDLAEHRERPCAEVDEIVARQLAATEKKIAARKRLRVELRQTLASCKGGRIAECQVIRALSPSGLSPCKGD
jgi:DNA-binding transcriptional MerR regulator